MCDVLPPVYGLIVAVEQDVVKTLERGRFEPFSGLNRGANFLIFGPLIYKNIFGLAESGTYLADFTCRLFWFLACSAFL